MGHRYHIKAIKEMAKGKGLPVLPSGHSEIDIMSPFL